MLSLIRKKINHQRIKMFKDKVKIKLESVFEKIFKTTLPSYNHNYEKTGLGGINVNTRAQPEFNSTKYDSQLLGGKRSNTVINNSTIGKVLQSQITKMNAKVIHDEV